MLARKISCAKWKARNYLAQDEIAADAIGADLRTNEDTLSWWRCSDDPIDIREVALALASKMNRLDKIDIVVVPDEILQSLSDRIRQTEGDTPVEDLRYRHVDVIHLDVERLVNIARLLAPRIRSGTLLFQFAKWEVSALLREALQAQRLAMHHLTDKVQEEL